MVYRRERTDEPTQFQNRLILPMSVFDIIGSIAWAFSSTPIPRGSNCTYGALGNQATCITQGFMITLGTIVPMYNAMLCIYYLLVVKYDIRDEVIAKYEPLMHLFAIIPPLSVSIVAATNDLFNNYSWVCWIVDRHHYDFDPNNENNEDKNLLITVIYIIAAVFGLLVLLVIGYCMINIYTFVKNRERAMNAYQFQRPGRVPASSSRLSNTTIETKKQAFLYVVSFILTYSFTIFAVVFDLSSKGKVPFPLFLIHGILAPLQGFWNFLTYIRPKLNTISRQNIGRSLLRRLYITVVHEPEHSSRQGRRGSMRRRRRRHSV